MINWKKRIVIIKWTRIFTFKSFWKNKSCFSNSGLCNSAKCRLYLPNWMLLSAKSPSKKSGIWFKPALNLGSKIKIFSKRNKKNFSSHKGNSSYYLPARETTINFSNRSILQRGLNPAMRIKWKTHSFAKETDNPNWNTCLIYKLLLSFPEWTLLEMLSSIKWSIKILTINKIRKLTTTT